MAVTSWTSGGSTVYVNLGASKSVTLSGSSISVSSLLPTISLRINNPEASGTAYLGLGSQYSGGWADTNNGPSVFLGTTILAYTINARAKSKVANNTYVSANWSIDSDVIYTSWLFSSSNSTTKTVTLTLKDDSRYGVSAVTASDNGGLYIIDASSARNYGTVATVTLNAPPTFNASSVSFDTSYVYAGLTTASVSVSSLSAKYGGTISEVKLTIGNQTATRTNNGTLSILLGAEGTFTPTVTVTDSRGQVTTKTLDAITVNGYTAPAVSFSVQRSLASGVPNDEGTYGAISADFTFTDVIADLAQPTIAIDGTTSTITWYASRATDGTLSGTVDWSTLSSPATVYGIVDAPNIQTSYQITVTPNDSISSGTPITQTLASAFYTIDFLAGGHGIAFGQPATEEGFFCNMDAHFKDKANLVRALFDFIHPVGSCYETSDTSFNPNNTWGGTWVLVSSKDAYVVEEGTSENWTYRKWSDGTSECWLTYTEPTAQGFSPTGSSFYRVITGLNFPSGSFVATPTVQATMSMGNVGAIEISSANSTTCATAIMSAVSSARAVTIYLYAKGKWTNTSETYYRWHRTA